MSITSGSLVGSDALSATYTYSVATPVNAGTYTITPSAAVFSVGSASNYAITYATGTLTINRKASTVTAEAKTKEYGANDPPLTFTTPGGALVGLESLSGSLTRAAGTNVGTYAIQQGTVNNAGNPNYDITFVGANLTITRRPVTVTPTSGLTKTYDGLAVTSSSLSFTITTGSLVGSDSLTGVLAVTGTNAATYEIGKASGADAANPNYDITAATGVNFTITQATVNIAIAAKTKVYGETDPVLTYTATPNVTLTGALTRAPGDNVGTYNITQGTLASANTTNYVIGTVTGATFTIGPKPITVTAEAKTKVFGANDPPLTFSTPVGALVGLESLSGSLTRAAGTDVGTYAIQQGTLANSNYTISFVSANLTITPAVVTVTPVDGQTKVFNSQEPTLTYVTSSASSVGVNITGNLGRVANEDVGTYAFTLGDLATGTPNVTLTLDSLGRTFSITPLAITVTASAVSKVFGAAEPALTYTTSPAGITLPGALLRVAGENVGTYAINQGTLTSSNYTITHVGAIFEITRPTVTVTPDPNQTKVYGATEPTLMYTTSPNVGTIGALGRVAGEALGTYTINLGGVTDSANFIVNFTSGVIFTITARPITVTAASHTITYGDATPVNSVSAPQGLATGDSFGATTYTYEGTGGTTYGPSPTAPTDAGTYSITPSNVTIVGSAASNYTIGYAAGTLTINRKTVAVTATSVSGGFGAVPVFTSSAPGLVGSEALGDVTYTFSVGGATPPTAVGTYTITPAVVSLAPGSTGNYTFTYTPGTFTILPTRVGAFFPDRGTYLGGTPFTITGIGFGPVGSLPDVTFGGLPVTGLVRVSDRMITGITPAFTLAEQYTEQLVNVVVTVTGGGTVTLPLAYTYLPPRPTPVMMTLFPPQGPTSGGTELTITGENLGGSNQAPPTVFVDGSASFSVTVSLDGSVVTAFTPPGPPGSPRDVELFTNEGAAGFVSAYTYIPPIPPLSPLVTLPVPTTAAPPLSTTTTAPPRSTTTTVPVPAGPNMPPPGVEPVRVPDASGSTALPTLLPGESLALDNGVPVPVSITVENNTDLVMNGQDWQLRLRGDCSVRVCTIEEQNGREVLEIEVDGAANVGGFGFMPGTLVHLWLFSDPIYMGSLLVAADGTYTGAVDLIGIEVGQHTLQANGISFDGKERSANLGVVVRTNLEPGGRLPSTGTDNTNPMVLVALLLTALGLVLVTNRRRRRLS